MSEGGAIGAYDNVGGNHYDKYGTRNPIARRLMDGFLGAFDTLSAQTRAKAAFEVGCGEGHLSLRLLRRGVAVTGCDLDTGVVEQANHAAEAEGYGHPFRALSIYDIDADRDAAELVICCEVLEHLPATAMAVDKLADLARPYLLVSVPREPIWRALNVLRGKYLRHLGNTPGHIQHWTSREFIRVLESRFDILAVRRPLPWTMALCKIRGPTSGGP